MTARVWAMVSTVLFAASIALAVAVGLVVASHRDDPIECDEGHHPVKVVFEDVDGKKWEAVVCATPSPD